MSTDCDKAPRSRFMLVGALPPPIHGMAMVNAFVREQLLARGVVPLVINMAAAALERSLLARMQRLPRVCVGWLAAASARRLRGGTLYMSLSGGWGQLYEIPFVLLARLRRMRIVLHHHSFAYLDRPRLLTHSLVSLAGADAIHVVLSHLMAQKLAETYPPSSRIVTASNAALVSTELTGRHSHRRYKLRTIGLLGNLSAEKGIFEFLDLMAAVAAEGLPVRGRIAGPFQDAVTERQVRSRLAGLANVEYVGPRYGVDKEHYFDTLDALVFPTRYANEAEPLTIHEAMCRGLPVIAIGRGAIAEIIGQDGGCVVPADQPFVELALARLSAWHAEPAVFEAVSAGALRRFAELSTASLVRWRDLFAELLA